MRLIESLRATSFSVPHVSADALEGVPAAVASQVINPLSRTICLPELRYLPAALAEPLGAYLEANRRLETQRRSLQNSGADPGQVAEAVAAVEAERDRAWIDVRTVTLEGEAGIIASTRAAKTAAIEQLHEAAAAVRAAAEAYAAAAGLEAAVANRTLSCKPSDVPEISTLDTALTGTSHDGSSGDGLHAALAAITTT